MKRLNFPSIYNQYRNKEKTDYQIKKLKEKLNNYPANNPNNKNKRKQIKRQISYLSIAKDPNKRKLLYRKKFNREQKIPIYETKVDNPYKFKEVNEYEDVNRFIENLKYVHKKRVERMFDEEYRKTQDRIASAKARLAGKLVGLGIVASPFIVNKINQLRKKNKKRQNKSNTKNIFGFLKPNKKTNEKKK